MLTPVGGNGIEFSSFLAEEDGYRFQDAKLNFREESAQGGEAFSVGLRNPQHRGDKGLVLQFIWMKIRVVKMKTRSSLVKS